MSIRIAALALAALAVACTPDTDTAGGVAQAFLDEHYVRMDLAAALEHCTGLARHKVEEEIRLIEGQEIDGTTMKPSVSYSLAEERATGENRKTFLYDGEVRLRGGGEFEMRWMVSVKRDEGVWKVSNFQEMQ